MNTESLKMSGKLIVTLKGENGEETSTYYNNIMFNTKVIVAKFLSGQNPGFVTHMAVGTDETVPDPYQNELFSEVYRKELNSAINQANVAILDCVYGEGEAVGSLKEAGLFTSDGIMIARANINETKGISQELTISWSISIS